MLQCIKFTDWHWQNVEDESNHCVIKPVLHNVLGMETKGPLGLEPPTHEMPLYCIKYTKTNVAGYAKQIQHYN